LPVSRIYWRSVHFSSKFDVNVHYVKRIALALVISALVS